MAATLNIQPQSTARNAVCVFSMMYALFAVVLLVGHLFQPLHVLAVHFFLNGNMRHAIGGRCAMPVFHAWRYPDDISQLDLTLFTPLLLHPAEASRHDQGLTERMSMPGRAGARLKRDGRARHA